MLRIVRLADPDRASILDRLCRRSSAVDPAVEQAARRIIADVRARGDEAVRELTLRFEGRTVDALEIDLDTWRREAAKVTQPVAEAIERAHSRIERFHEEEARRLRVTGFSLVDDERAHLELRVRPLARVGLYVPGGTARYPSSVLMTAVPARVAGVDQLILVTPGPCPETLLAAEVAGVDRVFAIGGAQAIAALAYGTATVPRVDKIVGPGNAYVAAAKRLVFGDVAIDQIAGPSEVLVLADARADPALCAADLLAQAEHDVDAYAVLVTSSESLAAAVADEVVTQLATLPRREIAGQALRAHGAAIVCRSLDEALAFTEAFAPEHLELLVDGGERIAERISSAGAIFIGAHTPEAAGDYLAGPNHVLPTGGSARFGSPLGVSDFLKRTSILRYTPEALVAQAKDIVTLAEAEGLSGHARAVTIRLADPGGESS
ncbi:MAG: histidinol dehydrogenase [Myxococcales bacterium]|nr:histidinol dehydrogenase [Myxococcales bacterium]